MAHLGDQMLLLHLGEIVVDEPSDLRLSHLSPFWVLLFEPLAEDAEDYVRVRIHIDYASIVH